ncbi:MAG: metallophosphoesterase [Candidatus Poribacteria bacterium]
MEPWTFTHICDMQPGSPKSFRYNPRFMENWQTAFNQLNCVKTDLLLVGGDLTRDGAIHDYEFEAIQSELNTLSYPYYAIPGNMDTGNKHALVKGAMGRDDPSLGVTAKQLDRFSKFFGQFPWSFVHKNVRFSGFYAASAGSGLPHEKQMWHWLEDELPRLTTAKHHVMTMHYALFIDHINEPKWDLTKQHEYHNWYFTIDPPHRLRIFEALKAAKVNMVLSGHIHCRRPVYQIDGIRFFKCAGIASVP